MSTQQAQYLKLILISSVILSCSLWILLKVELPGDSRVIYELQNAGHVLIFCLINFGLVFVLHRFWFKSALFLAIICGLSLSIIFGGASEFIQPWVGRDSSWDDLYKDVIGIVAGLFFYFAYIYRSWKRYLFAAIGASCVLYGLSSPLGWFYAKLMRDKNFPIIGDFENTAASRYIEETYRGVLRRVPAPEAWETNKSMVAEVAFHPAPWPGIHAFDLRGDWQDYTNFKFDVFNPQNEALELVVRIHDASHNTEHNDRFNKTLSIKPGAKEISIPISKIENTRSGRKMKMNKIRVIMLYMSKPEEVYTLYFDNFRLE